MNRYVRFDLVVVGYLVLCLVLGGASTQGYLANLVLQAFGAIFVAYCVWRPEPSAPTSRLLHLLWIAVALLAILPLIPLPPFIWSNLPGRTELAADFTLLGLPLPWQTLSLSPWDSVASLVWWLPAWAMFLVMRRSDGPSASLVARTVILVALASVAISSVQRSGGGLYPYDITNYGVGVGFFANANHQASFLLASLALLAGVYANQRATSVRATDRRTDMIVCAALALLLAGGVVLSNSLAGLGLLLPALLGCFLLVRPDLRIPTRISVVSGVAVGAAIGAIYVTGLLDNELGAGPGDNLNRAVFNVVGLRAALDFAPFGTGLGTFEAIYHLYEDPATVGNTYVNHAHNDLLELIIETGLLGTACLAIFLAWWLRRSLRLWRAPRKLPFAAAGSLLTFLIMAHSVVDYPLRTAAISCVFAIGFALMLRAATPDRESRQQRRSSQAKAHTMVRI